MKPVRHFLSPLRRNRIVFPLPMVVRRRTPSRVGIAQLLPLLLLAATSLPAQTPVAAVLPDRLDLQSAITFALGNNLAIRQARERIKEQEGVVVEVAARSIPNVAASATFQRNDSDIGQSFPPGDRSWQIGLTASQVLYAGGGVRSAVRSSKLGREAALLDLKAVINDVLLQVRTGYYAVLLAREQIKVQESNLQLLEEQLKTTSERFAAGTVSSFEKLRGEVAVANAKVPLITANNNYRLAIEALRQSLGVTVSPAAGLRQVPNIVGTLDFAPVDFDISAAFSAAQANRPELERLSKLAEAGEESVTVARSSAYPSVSAYGGWALRRGSTNTFGDSNHGWLVGLQSQWNIFDGRATAGRVTQARSRLEQTRLVYTEVQLAVEVEVRTAFSRWQEATELAEASQRVVEQATEAVRLADARYRAGTSTQLDVLQAQVELTTARSNQIQAYFSYNVSVATLRKATGQADEFVTN